MKATFLILAVAVGAIAALVLLAYLVGVFLPAGHVAEDERTIGAPVDLVAERVRNVAAQTNWRKGIKSIEILAPESSVMKYRETGANGVLTFSFREEAANRRFVSTIADDTLPFGGQWTIVLEPAVDGTTVRIREEGIVRPPIFRALSRFVFGHHASLRAYLNDLEVSFAVEKSGKA